MRLPYLTSLALSFLCGWSVASEPIAIEGRRELFVDQQLIESLDGAELFLHEPRDEGAVLQFDQPWEGLFCGYATVLHVDGKYQLYYRGRPELSSDGSDAEVTCYAESSDGIKWERPVVGRYAYDGSTQNNIVLAEAAPVTHNFSPFYDTRPGCNPEQRYKAVGGTAKSGLIAYVSADGIAWERFQKEPVIRDSGWVFDSQNVVFWSPSEERYVAYYRRSVERTRAIARCTSVDFVEWSDAEQMRYSNTASDVPANHLYTNQTHPYFRAPHIYVATAARFMPGRKVITDDQAATIGVHPKYFNDTSDAVLMTSRGGDLYDCTFDQGFVRPGIGLSNWVSRTNYPVLNVVQTGPTEMSLYTNQDYGQASAHLHRYSMRLDGFASLRSRGDQGEVITKPLTFTGQQLHINFATSAAGGIRIEIQHPDGTPIPGYSLDDADVIIGNEIEKVVSWSGQADVSELSGQPVRLRFVLNDADLFAFQFQQPSAELLSTRKIWDQAPHNAFTDLIRFKDAWYCVFREGQGHVSDDGSIRIIRSTDGENWKSVALLTSEVADLRDAKASIAPDGRLVLCAAGALLPPANAKHQSYLWYSSDGEDWGQPIPIGEPNYWIWRITWHDGIAYGIGYSTGDKRGARLYRSQDGKQFEQLGEDIPIEGYINETSIAFDDDGSAYCVIRQDGPGATAYLGRAEAPYEQWKWSSLGTYVGGPQLLEGPDKRWLVAGRRRDAGPKTQLWQLDPDAPRLSELVTFPSGGDTSYPGLVHHDGLLWVSYYSSHEGKTSIYLSKVDLNP